MELLCYKGIVANEHVKVVQTLTDRKNKFHPAASS